MLKNILSVFIGFVLGSLAVFAIQRLSAVLHPLPDGLDFYDPDALAKFNASLPLLAYILMISSHTLGGFIGSLATSKLASSQKFNLGLLTGFILLIATLSFYSMIKYPHWVVLADVAGLILLTYVGAKMGSGGVPDYDF